MEELDTVLRWFAMNPDEFLDYGKENRENISEAIIGTGILRYYPQLNDDKYFLVNLPLILKKLYKDGYLDQKQQPIGSFDALLDLYSINFDGKFFSQNGGYEAERKSLDARRRWEDGLAEKGEKNGERLNTLTLILGIGTIALALVELVKFVYQLCGRSAE